MFKKNYEKELTKGIEKLNKEEKEVLERYFRKEYEEELAERAWNKLLDSVDEETQNKISRCKSNDERVDNLRMILQLFDKAAK